MKILDLFAKIKRILVFISLITIYISGIKSYFFIILLKRTQIFTCFTELPFLHAFSNIPVEYFNKHCHAASKYLPMHESSLAVHQIKLVIQPGPSLCYSCGVG